MTQKSPWNRELFQIGHTENGPWYFEVDLAGNRLRIEIDLPVYILLLWNLWFLIRAKVEHSRNDNRLGGVLLHVNSTPLYNITQDAG